MSTQVIARLVKPCKGNRMSEWTFYNDNDTYYARNDQGKQIDCTSVQDARNFYKRMVTYGFHKPEMIKQMINVTPMVHSNYMRMPGASDSCVIFG
jgi:hypothetical protein